MSKQFTFAEQLNIWFFYCWQLIF